MECLIISDKRRALRDSPLMKCSYIAVTAAPVFIRKLFGEPAGVSQTVLRTVRQTVESCAAMLTSMPERVRHVVGCMTGTSIDALDAALIEVVGSGLDVRIRLLGGVSRPLGAVGQSLRKLADGAAVSAREIASTALAFGELHAQAAGEVALLAPGGRVDLVALHGQTVFHAPPVSWQLISPWPVARLLGCPVVFDLRGADLAAGGQGAPITPLFDWLTLRDVNESVAVVNLGGFCNITLLPRKCSTSPPRKRRESEPGFTSDASSACAEGSVSNHEHALSEVQGRDVCACNQLLDAVARRVLSMEYDDGGRCAAEGTAHASARDELMVLLNTQGRGGRSLGTGDELTAWMTDRVAGAGQTHMPPNDLARTVAEAVGMTIGTACRQSGASRVLLAGGGIHHSVLVAAIGEAAGVTPRLTDEYGVPAAYREAMAIAALGALCQDRMPITLAQVTGAAGPVGVSGCWVML